MGSKPTDLGQRDAGLTDLRLAIQPITGIVFSILNAVYSLGEYRREDSSGSNISSYFFNRNKETVSKTCARKDYMRFEDIIARYRNMLTWILINNSAKLNVYYTELISITIAFCRRLDFSRFLLTLYLSKNLLVKKFISLLPYTVKCASPINS